MSNPFEQCEQAQEFTRLWTEMATQMWTAGLNWQPTSPPPEAARRMRAGVFQAMSQFFDQFMRSPQTLEWMKQSMDIQMTFRKQFNDFMTRMRHEGQATTSEDIDSLMLTMRHLETRVLDRLEDVGQRLVDIDRRLQTLEGAEPAEGNGHSAGRGRLGKAAVTPKASESGSQND